MLELKEVERKNMNKQATIREPTGAERTERKEENNAAYWKKRWKKKKKKICKLIAAFL